MKGDIFISYRRETDSGTAGRLYDRLNQELPDVPVFMDVEKLAPGEDFEHALDKSLARCAVVLAVIGPKWAELTTADGQPRLMQDDDFVRRELGTALQRGVLVIPVLVQDARLPVATALPPELKPLLRRQAFEVRHERFDADVKALARAIGGNGPRHGTRKFATAAAAIVALTAAGVVAYRQADRDDRQAVTAQGAVAWSTWLDQAGYQREFERELSRARYPRMLEAAKPGETLVYRANFVAYPSNTFAFDSRHSLNDQEFAAHENRMKAKGFRRAFHQRFVDGDRAYNQGTWTKP